MSDHILTKTCAHEIGPWPGGQQWPHCLKCEIERLRGQLDRIVTAYDHYRGRGVLPAPGEYAAVVEAIEAARPSSEPDRMAEYNAEIEQLREDNARLKGEAFVLKTANARLRAALLRIAKCEYDGIHDTDTVMASIAQQALGLPMLLLGIPGDAAEPSVSPFDRAAILGAPRERRISMSFETQEQYEAALVFLDMADPPESLRGPQGECPTGDYEQAGTDSAYAGSGESPALPHTIEVVLCPSCAATLAVAQAKARELALKSPAEPVACTCPVPSSKPNDSHLAGCPALKSSEGCKCVTNGNFVDGSKCPIHGIPVVR
jgi:hypothetical protein